MKLRHLTVAFRARHEAGTVLAIVLWIALGLVSITLYFAQSMTFELRASDNRLAGTEAEEAIEGVARYVSVVLSNNIANEPGKMPEASTYQSDALLVGAATVWISGREDAAQSSVETPAFGLIDECSKLNLNLATLEMLEALPRMTPEFAAAIIDWRDSDSDVQTGGAESETYQRLRPAYSCKNAPLESVDELRWVQGCTTEILFGEDLNLNGLLDLNENDGPTTLPDDNRDSRLDPGIFDLVTVYSREPNTRSDGTPRIHVGTQRPQLQTYLQEKFSRERAQQIFQASTPPAGPGFTSLIQFFLTSRMTLEEFETVAGDLTTATGQYMTGLVNVASAPVEVLSCIPGIDSEKATALVTFRQNNPTRLTSVAWVTEVLDRADAIQAGPYLTARTFQFSADLAAVGHHGRGYKRTRFIFDTADGTPRLIRRQDLAHLGWALGPVVRRSLLAENTR